MKKTILTLISVLIVLVATGQNLFNQSTIFISPSTTLFVGGDLVNNNLIINNGDMQVGGAWTNNNQYDAGTGKITFNSDLPQVINHNAQSFSRLTISGGGVKNFSADITILNELDLQDGMLVSQNDSRIVFEQGATILGGSDLAHINGPVYQRGTGDKLFPVGNGTQYLPVEIQGISATTEVGVALVEFATPQSFEFKPELSGVSEKRYWTVDLVSGALTGTQISLPIKGDEGLSAASTQYVVTQSPDSPTLFESLGQSDFTGTVADGRIVSQNGVSAHLVSVGILSEGIVVYNAVSANQDDQINAILTISNIDAFPNNRVSIFNRWGDKVFEMKGYKNDDPQKVFYGNSNVGGNNELPAGTYYYVVDKGDGSALVNGYLSLKR
jgi:gliding motility-associated-like protein